MISNGFKVTHYELLDDYILDNCDHLDKWKVFDYLIKYHRDDERVDLYIPSWLYNYLKETELENYHMTLLRALSMYFRIYGVSDYEDSADELLVIGMERNKD